MAVNADNNQTGSQGAQPQQQPKEQSNKLWNFHNRGTSAPTISSGTEYSNKFRDAIVALMKDAPQDLDIKVVNLSRQHFTELKYAAIVIALAHKHNIAGQQPVVATYALILEATGEKLKRREHREPNGISYTTYPTMTMAWDRILRGLVQAEVQQLYKNHQVLLGDYMAVPSTVAVDDPRIEDIVRNALTAAYTLSATARGDFDRLSLKDFDRSSRLNITVDFGQAQTQNILSEPVRSSVIITTTQQTRNQNANSGDFHVEGDSERIYELTGFMNAVWSPVDMGMGYNPYLPVQAPPQKFVSEFVITRVDSPRVTSPAGILFGVSSFLAILDNDAYLQAFLPRGGNNQAPGTRDVVLDDFGALNVPANITNERDLNGFGRPIDTTLFNGDLVKTNTALSQLFRRGAIISIDCEECGPDAWKTSVFAEAASGNAEAILQMRAALIELFGEDEVRVGFPEGTAFFSHIFRVSLGHYYASNQKTDIRTVDNTIAVANLFWRTDPKSINDYMNTFTDRPGISPERNLADRETIIMHGLREQAVIDNYAARVTFSEELIAFMSSRLAQLHLPISVSTPLSADSLRGGVAAPSYVAGSIASGLRTFTHGYGGQAYQTYRFNDYRRR